jgi:hypothetical protein
MTKTILLFFMPLQFFTAKGQSSAIETDRPDQTESPSIVPKKWIQIEAGFLAENQGFFTNYTMPTVLSKLGISRTTELRLITELNGTNSKLYEIGVAEITTPLQLGFKTAICQEKGLLPKTSIIVHSALQSIKYNGIFSTTHTKEIAFNYRFTLQNTLSKVISVGYNVGMEWERMSEAPAYIYTLATGFNITSKWYAYVESFGSIWTNDHPQNSVDVGIAYNATNDFKIDISAGKGISNSAPPYYFAIGASVRFKTFK